MKLLVKLFDEALETTFNTITEWVKGTKSEYDLVLTNETKILDITSMIDVRYIIIFTDQPITVNIGNESIEIQDYFLFSPTESYFSSLSTFELETSLTKVKVKVKIIGEFIPTIEDPIADIAGGTFVEAQNIQLACPTAGVTIVYTLDDSDPTPTNGTTFNGTSITISTTSTLKFYAYKDGYHDSQIISQTYTII